MSESLDQPLTNKIWLLKFQQTSIGAFVHFALMLEEPNENRRMMMFHMFKDDDGNALYETRNYRESSVEKNFY